MPPAGRRRSESEFTLGATMDAGRRLTFGDLSLDLTSQRLWYRDEVAPLTPKAFAVLRRLVEDRGQVVFKEELLRAGWAKTHVSDGVLKVAILEIRRALGDDAAAPSFIETVPRRGYRFIGPRAGQAPAAVDPRGAPVGRDRVLAQLADRLASAVGGERQLVFLSGEAGIGKTTVIDALLAHAAFEPELTIARGACLEHYGAAEAYLPVLEALHWSDHSTLDLLAMLGRRQESARLLVVGSYRPVDAIVTGHPLRALIQELRVRRQCEDIALPFLREQHVAAYLAQRFGGHAFPSELARAVHQRTDGNPLFMVRVLDELVALRVLEPEDDRWRLRGSVREISHAVPDSLRALVEKQIDRLQPEAQRVLEAASVLGTEFTTGSVAAGLDLDPLTIEDRCDELVRQGQFLSAATLFVRPDGTQVARYRFIHSLYPHAIAERVPPGWRLRQRVGEWLERAYGAQVAAIAGSLAWHFEEAGD